MLCGLGGRRSVDDLVQMIGRATYNGSNHLERNLGPGAKVEVLINFRDWDLVNDYLAFQDEVAERLTEP
jgi:hypothetical protein